MKSITIKEINYDSAQITIFTYTLNMISEDILTETNSVALGPQANYTD
jgi:hypothetical protein